MAAIACDVVLEHEVQLILYVIGATCIVFITRLEKIPFGISMGPEKGPVSEGHVEQLTWLLLQTAYST